MRPKHLMWIGLFIFAALVTWSTKYFPYFPGDVAVARWVQSLVPPNLNWATAVSRTAEFPELLLIWAVIFSFSWALAGRRATLLSIFSLVGVLALGKWLGPVIARPRPSPELVQVFRSLSGSSFPSQFALRYGAAFGFLAILAAIKSSGWRRAGLLLGCGALLILGGVARIALGAHWPSDVLIYYYLGLLWSAFLIRFAPLAGRSSSSRTNDLNVS